jgi:hypothetical protein
VEATKEALTKFVLGGNGVEAVRNYRKIVAAYSLLTSPEIAECRRLKPAPDIIVGDLDATLKRRSTRKRCCQEFFGKLLPAADATEVRRDTTVGCL